MDRPNLLFLFTDEQRADTLAAYGNRRIRMPHLDRLAAQGTLFERAYVTQPVCTPSRSSIMTGLYPHTNGCTENNVPLDEGVPTIAEILGPGDTVTGYFGKWHLGDEIFAQHGFRAWRSIDDGYRGYYRPERDRDARSTYHHWLIARGYAPENGTAFTRGEVARFPEDVSKPAYLGEEASRFIRDHRSEPWCLYVNFLEPHMPFYGPRDGQYAADETPLPESFAHPPGEDHPLKTRLFHEAYRARGHNGYDLSGEDGWRELISNYWGLCCQVDTHCGRILDALEASGQADRTLVVFTSDHGDMMGSHRLLAKCVLFEEAARVPLMVRLPGQTEGRRIPEPVSQIDLVPTLLDLMGHDVPDGLQGRSLAPVLAGDATPDRDVVYEWNGPNCGLAADRLGQVEVPDCLQGMVTTEELEEAITDPVRGIVTRDGWKLNWSPRGDHELYDLNTDPMELANRVGEADQRGRVEDLVGRLKAWQAGTGDMVELPEP